MDGEQERMLRDRCQVKWVRLQMKVRPTKAGWDGRDGAGPGHTAGHSSGNSAPSPSSVCLHGMTFLVLSEGNPVWTPLGHTQHIFFSFPKQ